ncbi:Bacteriophage lambda NinG [uncultured Caudovirales phage]|uniref:Protein ninG n=1 Tax=uncultured Caudovirales phage TaxID=2100421 RepID=A0A6J5RYX1_9CAUD|nr:Bacteriophage lambda NinG [uncultured Caudovirales phage]CAB4171488.1 Bacteriophage lambda NinG [uncultured Caudovirales phage]CAB4177313.1 Bacteriophage lambda NinG [uncultured Caudovirales phage]CAB4199556.1 Bacteriophage lambda NinG [uncultured Caudovirales phage]CAB4213543.1 Bacteriophage lambda NinG [uncultured Caudovirales phage]
MKKQLPKCKFCKTRFVPFGNNGLQPYCLKTEECRTFATSIVVGKVKKANDKKERAKDKATKIEVYKKENTSDLQKEINKLARMIDTKFDYTTCIDCGRNFGKQTDAAHYHSRGAHPALRFNLDNLHSAASNCNQWSDKHKEGYKDGLVTRYGEAYAHYIYSLPLDFPETHLTAQDIYEKLTLVRKLIRTFESYKFESSIQARKLLNKIINIYQ